MERIYGKQKGKKKVKKKKKKVLPSNRRQRTLWRAVVEHNSTPLRHTIRWELRVEEECKN